MSLRKESFRNFVCCLRSVDVQDDWSVNSTSENSAEYRVTIANCQEMSGFWVNCSNPIGLRASTATLNGQNTPLVEKSKFCNEYYTQFYNAG